MVPVEYLNPDSFLYLPSDKVDQYSNILLAPLGQSQNGASGIFESWFFSILAQGKGIRVFKIFTGTIGSITQWCQWNIWILISTLYLPSIRNRSDSNIPLALLAQSPNGASGIFESWFYLILAQYKKQIRFKYSTGTIGSITQWCQWKCFFLIYLSTGPV